MLDGASDTVSDMFVSDMGETEGFDLGLEEDPPSNNQLGNTINIVSQRLEIRLQFLYYLAL